LPLLESSELCGVKSSLPFVKFPEEGRVGEVLSQARENVENDGDVERWFPVAGHAQPAKRKERREGRQSSPISKKHPRRDERADVIELTSTASICSTSGARESLGTTSAFGLKGWKQKRTFFEYTSRMVLKLAGETYTTTGGTLTLCTSHRKPRTYHPRVSSIK
jgi:hypothetical protein